MGGQLRLEPPELGVQLFALPRLLVQPGRTFPGGRRAEPTPGAAAGGWQTLGLARGLKLELQLQAAVPLGVECGPRRAQDTPPSPLRFRSAAQPVLRAPLCYAQAGNGVFQGSLCGLQLLLETALLLLPGPWGSKQSGRMRRGAEGCGGMRTHAKRSSSPASRTSKSPALKCTQCATGAGLSSNSKAPRRDLLASLLHLGSRLGPSIRTAPQLLSSCRLQAKALRGTGAELLHLRPSLRALRGRLLRRPRMQLEM